VRQTVTLNVGISTDKAKEIGKFIKELGLKGVSHQIQGDQLRVSGKKRDDLQSAIAAMKDHDFAVPLPVSPTSATDDRSPAARVKGGRRMEPPDISAFPTVRHSGPASRSRARPMAAATTPSRECACPNGRLVLDGDAL
jgi:hypothetical protein